MTRFARVMELEADDRERREAQIEAGARKLAEWIGYNYDSLRDGRIANRGFKQWATNGVGALRFQGGKQDLRDLAAAIIKSE